MTAFAANLALVVDNPRVAAKPDDDLGLVGARLAFAAGEEIFAQDEEADFVYRLMRGAVRTVRLLPDGRRQIGDFYGPGELFGLEPGGLHRFAAEALEPCEVLVIRKSALDQGGEAVQRLVRDTLARELDRAQSHLMLIGHRSACEKVAGFLLDIAARSPLAVARLPMGRQDMADYLGLTIETVSRMLTQLQADHVVAFEDQRRFRLNVGAARRLTAA